MMISKSTLLTSMCRRDALCGDMDNYTPLNLDVFVVMFVVTHVNVVLVSLISTCLHHLFEVYPSQYLDLTCILRVL